MRRVRDTLLRLGFRAGWWALRVWGLVDRSTKQGVKCVLTRDGDVLLVRHTYGDRSRWELPGGGIKRRERPVDAARREIDEELGIEVDDWTPLGDLFERIDRRRDRLWCFSAEVGGRELELDRAEIAEAEWFEPDRLPPETARYVARITALAPLARLP
jgi:8-oxo-dGTP pyrophosphatase MutT (NUDIX family)